MREIIVQRQSLVETLDVSPDMYKTDGSDGIPAEIADPRPEVTPRKEILHHEQEKPANPPELDDELGHTTVAEISIEPHVVSGSNAYVEWNIELSNRLVISKVLDAQILFRNVTLERWKVCRKVPLQETRMCAGRVPESQQRDLETP